MFKHYCYEWDEMEIDETMPEFIACTCYSRSLQSEDVKHIQDELNALFYPWKKDEWDVD